MSDRYWDPNSRRSSQSYHSYNSELEDRYTYERVTPPPPPPEPERDEFQEAIDYGFYTALPDFEIFNNYDWAYRAKGDITVLTSSLHMIDPAGRPIPERLSTREDFRLAGARVNSILIPYTFSTNPINYLTEIVDKCSTQVQGLHSHLTELRRYGDVYSPPTSHSFVSSLKALTRVENHVGSLRQDLPTVQDGFVKLQQWKRYLTSSGGLVHEEVVEVWKEVQNSLLTVEKITQSFNMIDTEARNAKDGIDEFLRNCRQDKSERLREIQEYSQQSRTNEDYYDEGSSSARPRMRERERYVSETVVRVGSNDRPSTRRSHSDREERGHTSRNSRWSERRERRS
ncbi:hypothetical protein TREMEDRAFT_59538 [Tremella mesenterica DSM 1558]|uniref:uncharacterized protein n=1 Tax=Tremella mesenterica (strain ATCC 24925 / CBS 8224 / DSM 1558 / NBRC 9311 / NRRL Y-6157 / RJB 2259-6 / UBC 559-6) TaxID=578456 RepID=UPI0003F491D0|nr:uncharacterized protein TREMEDRAFT_59538 [Tremella mesenterica DSM 1558]EIW73373.1 hypothetical protein TREMEDRAFT_59538 [Tremella mesenterica DSM 1558]